MHKPTVSHFGDAKRLLKYVKGAMTHGLHFTSGALSLNAYTNADWAGDQVILLIGGLHLGLSSL